MSSLTFVNKIYYTIKPALPKKLWFLLRRILVWFRYRNYKENWPINPQCFTYPNNWTGWPDGKKFALVLTHDVDTAEGVLKCKRLANLEKKYGFRSGFYFVPEGYNLPTEIREDLLEDNFEVGVHGLNHDGKLLFSKKKFQKRAHKINYYLKKWKASGFRAPAMHHNLEWFQMLNINYDLSTFDFDPFEPQSDGIHNLFPLWIGGNSYNNGYVELPYTLPQDSTLFLLHKEKTIKLWKQKLDWIAENGGMALLISHPDYLHFDNESFTDLTYPSKLYEELLLYIKERYKDKYWHVLPREISDFWKSNRTKFDW